MSESLPKRRKPAEEPVWAGHPSQYTNIKMFLVCGLFFWLVLPIFVALWRWLVVRCTTYELTTQRFRTSLGVVTRHTEELELYRVKDLSYSQDIFQRVFGLTSIRLMTSDPSTPEVIIDSINSTEAKELREKIRTLTEELRERKQVREIDYT